MKPTILPLPDLIGIPKTPLGDLLNLNALQYQFDRNNFLLEKFDPKFRAEAIKGKAVLELWDMYDRILELKGKQNEPK